MGERLDDDVDRLVRERALERGALGREVPRENKVDGAAAVEPAAALDPARACAARSTVASLSDGFDESAMSVATRTA